jgi:chromosome segregation ATPase
MSDTPRTDAREWDWHEDCSLVDDMIVDADFARQLERELAEAREDRDVWKANHDNQVALNRLLRDRPDLGERAKLVDELIQERDTAQKALFSTTEDYEKVVEQRDALKSELDEMTARAISLSMHLPPQTLAGDVQKWRDEALEEMNSLKRELAEAHKSIEASTDTFIELRAELDRWRELPAKVEGLIPQTNIPLSAAVVRTTALNQVLDLIATVKGGEA